MKKRAFPITPIQFWTVFSEKLRNEFYKNGNKQLRLFTTYQANKKWTVYVTKFLLDLGQEFTCKSSQEYFVDIDVAYFNKVADHWAEWSFEVAIEIEKDPKTWMLSEYNKLMHIACGLKVIISYDSTDTKTLLKWLNGNGTDASQIRKIHKSRKYHQNGDNWLLLFGPTSNKSNQYEAAQDFRAFSFDGTKFIKLPDKKILAQ